jgi:hypothetical protein
VAALGNMEMLPWDVWGAMSAPDETIGADLIRNRQEPVLL